MKRGNKQIEKIVIIGGGIAGLSAGIYAQRNGFQSLILEKHRIPGGQCTGWDRGGYHIDGCIHWLTGTKEGSPLNRLWNEVGALDGVEIVHPDSFLCFEQDGQRACILRDIDKLQQHWTELSPADADTIREFCQDVRLLQSFSFPVDKPQDLMGPLEKLKTLLSMRNAGQILQKYGRMTIREFAERFRCPAIREGFGAMAPTWYNAAMIFFAIAAFTADEASIPAGGSRALARRMTDTYLRLGGRVETSCEVSNVEIHRRQVQSLQAADGRSFAADFVIAACDAHHLYHTLLQNRYPDRAFESRFANPTDYPLASEVLVAIGFKGRVEDLNEPMPWSVSFPIEPIAVNRRPIFRLTVKQFSHEPGFAPQGETLLICDINQYDDDFDAWTRLGSEEYRGEKQRIGAEVIAALETRFPAMRGRLVLLDVATPATYERYCNAHRGAFMAFFPTVKGKMMSHSGKIKGLDNMVLSSQWLQPPGGLPTALMAGRNAIMRLCRRTGRSFS